MAITTSTALIAASTATAAASAAMAASQRNKAAKTAQSNAVSTAKVNEQIVGDQADSARTKLAAEFGKYNKTVVASSSVRGALDSASTEAMQRASLNAALIDQNNIETSVNNETAAIWAGAKNRIDEARSQWTSPLFSGFTGGLGGLQAGLALDSSLKTAGIIEPGKKGS